MTNNRKKIRNGNGNGNGNHNRRPIKAVSQPKIVVENKLAESEKIEGPVKGHIEIIDSNIPIHRPTIINEAREGGNLLVIPWTTLFELNTLKNRPLIGYDAREAIRLIDKAIDDGDTNLIIETSMDYVFNRKTLIDNPRLDKQNPDHQIIATVNAVYKKSLQKDSVYYGYQKIKFISDDSIVRIMSKTLFKGKNISTELLMKDRVKKFKAPTLRSIRLASSKEIKLEDAKFTVPYKTSYRLKENEAAIFLSKYDLNKQAELEEEKARFLGIRKGSKVILVSPTIKVYGLSQLPLPDGKVNWAQVAAMNMLLNPDIDLVILQGAPGTGKTLLALAACLDLFKTKKYKNIIVARVTEPIDRRQSIGLLPGGVEAKMAPWVLPIVQNLSILRPNSNAAPKNGYDESNVSLIEAAGISIQPIDFIRGTTFKNTLFIVEEVQDCTQDQIKSLITRAGEGSKMILTGCLSQIDEGTKLDISSSGLTHVISRTGGQDLIAIVNFKKVVRSRLARLAEKLL